MAWSVLLRRSNAQKQLYRNFSSHADPKQLEAAFKLWQNLTYFGVPVALGLGALNVYLTWEEPKAPEFIPYDHLRIRTKRFPWGDGQHSFFHNPHLNALPNGYEHEH